MHHERKKALDTTDLVAISIYLAMDTYYSTIIFGLLPPSFMDLGLFHGWFSRLSFLEEEEEEKEEEEEEEVILEEEGLPAERVGAGVVVVVVVGCCMC